MLRSRLVRAVARLWWLHVYIGSAAVPVPRDSPSIRSGSDDADRVLVLGNGAASGWGVLTHGLGLPGRIAAWLQHRTGRPCDLDLLGDEVMNVASAPDWIGDRPLDGYDAVVVVLGFGDALRHTDEPMWRAELERLIHILRRRMRPSAGIVVTGIEPIAAAGAFRGPLAALAQRQADRLNTATRAIVGATPDAAFVELLPASAADATGPERTAYDHWGEQLADAVSPLLDRARAAVGRVSGAIPAPRTPARPAGDLSGLRALVEDAKREFGVDLAWVGLHEGDRQVIAVSTEDRSPASVPMDLTFCRYTEGSGDTFVVPDAPADPRFAGNPFLGVLHLEAYAGHPVHDGDGAVIGTFCLASIRPRADMGAVVGRLERYAREAEGELVRGSAGAEQAEASATR